MRRLLLASFIVSLLAPAGALAAPKKAASPAGSKAGVAVVDATWHVGASAGQFTDDTGPQGDGTVDPHMHTTKKRISDGVALRTSTRALVVEDASGDRVAIVAHDMYLAQDFLLRRLAHLIETHDRKVDLGLAKDRLGITADSLAMTASHNHNTPYYSTPGWGTAIFQDVIDLRFYEYMAEQMFRAVKKAAADIRPVRMGGATRTFDAIQSHTYGPKVADDGTPAGQPYSHTTRQLSVVKFDDMTDPKNPRPYANWVVFGVHPEWTWGYDLINGDITHAAARMVDRDLGTRSVFTQRETGSSGPHKDTRVHRPEDRREFQDNGFGQLDRGARMLADAIKATIRDIDSGTPERQNAFQPFTTDFDVDSVSMRFAPPATRPFPGVSNCNSASLFHGDPRLPVLGLPDCQGTNAYGTGPATGIYKPITSPLYEQLKEAGVPIPESYSATALTAVEETAAVHLMAIRLGGIGVTICPCEQFTDTALNIESRLDRTPKNIWKGFDWTKQKTPAGRDWCIPTPGKAGFWTCANPQNPAADLAPVSDLLYRRMVAQINNDAAGWETDLKTLGSEAEPYDPSKIKGNFTHEEHTEHGYNLVLAVGMGNDYWGYTPEYREMRSHDHYRKALNGLGLHGADYLATRLSRLAASLNGGDEVRPSPLDLAYTAEQGRANAAAVGLGEAAREYTKIYERQLPADGGEPGIVTQPKSIERFSATHLAFIGGSNYTDLPDARVQRLVGNKWTPFGDMTGDVEVMVDFPKPDQLTAWRTGTFQWKWTAAFEAFSSDVAQHDLAGKPRQGTPAGTYRFVVSGKHRSDAGGKPEPYELESEPFTVSAWDGVTAEDLRVEADGTVSFLPGPAAVHTFGARTYTTPGIDYPDGYDSPFRFISNKRKLFTYGIADPARHQQYCPRCSFRPWADTGALATALVTFVDAAGVERTVQASAGDGGRWRTTAALSEGESAFVAAGDLETEHGETNGSDSARVTR